MPHTRAPCVCETEDKGPEETYLDDTHKGQSHRRPDEGSACAGRGVDGHLGPHHIQHLSRIHVDQGQADSCPS